MIIDLPGVKKEDIKLYIDGRKLIIDGHKREYIRDRFCDSIKYHRIERPIGNFHREVVLPSYVELDDMKIEYTDGVLHIILKKPKKTVIRVE
jgi:HSP20 family protein